MTTENKPNQEHIDQVTQLAISNIIPQKWELISLLTQLTTENKPSQKAIDKILTPAIAAQQWELFKNVCELKTDNAPSQEATGSALVVLASKDNLDMIKYVCNLTSASKPSSDAAHRACSYAAGLGHLDVVQYFCEVSADYKPDQKTIAESLVAAAYAYDTEKHLNCVKYLCSLTGDHRPQQNDINNALDSAVTSHLSFTNDLTIIKYLCELTGELAPSQEVIETAFKRAIVCKNLQLILYFTELTKNNKPLPETLAEASKLLSVTSQSTTKVVLEASVAQPITPATVTKPVTETIQRSTVQPSMPQFFAPPAAARVNPAINPVRPTTETVQKNPVVYQHTASVACNLSELSSQISTEIKRLESGKQKNNFWVGVGLIIESDRKINALTQLKSIIDQERLSKVPSGTIQNQLINWNKTYQKVIEEQRNRVHAFFAPNHQSRSSVVVNQIMNTLMPETNTSKTKNNVPK